MYDGSDADGAGGDSPAIAPGELFPHQREGLRRLAEFKGGGFGLFYAPGGGKTRCAIEYTESCDDGLKTLVVCPAFVRRTWQREWKIWGRRPLNIQLLSSGKDVEAASAADVAITSYELLKHVDWAVGRLVLDEAHYVSQEKSQRSGEVRRIANLDLETYVLALTGSPAPKEPKDLWNLLDTMNPGMFGSYWSFVRRYCKEVPQPYAPSGKMWIGLREDRAPELMRRLDAVSHRVTFDEFAAHVPRMRMSPVFIKPARAKKGLDWDDPQSFEALLGLNSSAKIDTVCEITQENLQAGITKFCWGVWLHQTAETLRARMEALGLKTFVVNGETPSDKRQAVFDAWARCAEPTVMIAGIAAVGVGVNELVAAQVAGCVEIPWRPSDLDQFMKRFERLNSTFSTMFYFFVVENSRDEKAAKAYLNRKADINAVIAAGEDDMAAIGALKNERSDEDLLRDLLL